MQYIFFFEGVNQVNNLKAMIEFRIVKPVEHDRRDENFVRESSPAEPSRNYIVIIQ